MTRILSEDMRDIANKVNRYLDSIKETEENANKAQLDGEDTSLDDLLTKQADGNKLIGSINIPKLTQILKLPPDKIEMFKNALEALQKEPPQLDSQQASVLAMAFERMSNSGNVNEVKEPVQITKGDDPKLDEILSNHVEDLEKFSSSGELDDGEFFMELYTHFLNSGEMPYGVAKAREGDPNQWVANKLSEYLEKSTLDESEGGDAEYKKSVSNFKNDLKSAGTMYPNCKGLIVQVATAMMKGIQGLPDKSHQTELMNLTADVVALSIGDSKEDVHAALAELENKFEENPAGFNREHFLEFLSVLEELSKELLASNKSS